MTQQQLSSPEETHAGDTPGERVTLSIPIPLVTPTRRTVVREGPKPERPTGRNREYLIHYHEERNHQGLGGQIIVPPWGARLDGPPRGRYFFRFRKSLSS